MRANLYHLRKVSILTVYILLFPGGLLTQAFKQRTPKLLDNILLLWTIDKRGRTEAIPLDVEVFEAVLSSKQDLIFWASLATPILQTIKIGIVKLNF